MPRDVDELEYIAGAVAAPMYMCLSIVGALAAKGLVEPEYVARLAEMFASPSVNHAASPVAVDAMRIGLQEFVRMVRITNAAPAGTGHA